MSCITVFFFLILLLSFDFAHCCDKELFERLLLELGKPVGIKSKNYSLFPVGHSDVVTIKAVADMLQDPRVVVRTRDNPDMVEIVRNMRQGHKDIVPKKDFRLINLVARDKNNEIIGLIQIGRAKQVPDAEHWGELGLFVKPDAWRQGHGRRLRELAEDYARRFLRLRGFYSYVHVENAASHANEIGRGAVRVKDKIVERDGEKYFVYRHRFSEN